MPGVLATYQNDGQYATQKKAGLAIMNICQGDYVEWTEPVFHGGSFSRWGRRPVKYVGDRTISGTVLKSSYGSATTCHWLTILVESAEGIEPPKIGAKIRRKAKNVYKNGYSVDGDNHKEAAEEKRHQKLWASLNCDDPIRSQILKEQSERS